MSYITTTSANGGLAPLILQSIAPAMLYTPTPGFNYILICDKVSMPQRGGSTMRFFRPKALVPPTIQLGNSGIEPNPQIPSRDVIDAELSLFGTSCIINEQVLIQDQDPRRNGVYKSSLIDVEFPLAA